MSIENTNKDYQNCVEENDGKEGTVVPDGLFPGSTFVEDEGEEDVDDVGGDEVGGAAFGEAVPTVLEVAVAMFGVGYEIVTVGVVYVTGAQTQAADDKMAPEDEVVLQVEEVGVGNGPDEFAEGIAHAEAESNQEGVDKVFVDQLNGGEVGAVLGQNNGVYDR